MDRVILGKATTNTTSTTYSRSEKSGLFISAPGANVHNCSDGDLIFDSTSPGIVQILGRGRALVPKQVYDKGLYGEEGVITESNWNSVDRSIPRELNPKTSWAFDAILQVSSESKKIKANWNTATAYTKAGGTEEILYAGTPREDALNNSMWKIPGLGVYDNELAIRDMIKKMWRITEVFPFLRDLVWTIKGGDNSFISKGLQSHLLRNDVNPDDATTWWRSNRESQIAGEQSRLPHLLFSGVWSGRQAYINRNNLSESNNNSGPGQAGELPKLPTGEYDLIPAEWVTAFNDTAGTSYPTTTAFSGDLRVFNEPKIWRALSSAGDTDVDEESLRHDFIQMLSIFAWSHENFGKFLETTNDVAVDFYDPENSVTPTGLATDYLGRGITTAPAGTYRIFDILLEGEAEDIPPRGEWNSSAPKYHFETGHLDAKYFTDFNTTSNWGYTQWRNGEVEISTGVEPPDGVPVQVWWNSISRPTGNTSTNLSFLDIRDHFAKQSTSSERLTALKPGISSVRANTYVENNEVKLRITQPSTEDTSEVYYTVFREPAVGESETYNASLIFNITDVDDPNFPGDNYAGKRQTETVDYEGATRLDYGRYYSVVFPDDFVQTKFTATDPFREYRDPESGKIDSALSITLNIPSGVELSGSGHGNYILPDEVLGADRYYGANEYGPKDTYGRPSWDRFGMIDPCIKLNLASTEWTDGALQDLLIRIENNGVLVGAGGYGQYGQSTPQNTKQIQNSSNPGGGGGGGAGYHPPLKVESPTSDWIGAANNFTHPSLGDYEAIRDLGISGRLDEHRESRGYDGSTIELDMHRGAISTHWQGPNNYVEWGVGGRNELANYYTGMNKITMDSLGPGKPGTGYLGMAGGSLLDKTYFASDRSYLQLYLPADLPYWDTLLERVDAFGRYDDDLYVRLPGTYHVTAFGSESKGTARGGPMEQRGFEGSAGTKTSGGSGGGAGDFPTKGTPQDTINQIKWTGEGESSLIWHNGITGDFNSGQPGAGHGGSLVYLYANTETVGLGGTIVRLINNVTGVMKSGGGGGSAGSDTGGLRGGNLGRPGGLPVGAVGSLSDLVGESSDTPTGGNNGNLWANHSRRGEPGKLVWWNSDNLTSDYTIVNNSDDIDNSIEGLDYNINIDGWDYVSYAPSITVSTSTQSYLNLSGQKYWARTTGSVYTDMGEQSFVDYFNQIGGIVG